ncbi:MAG: hypothetical protein RMK18_08525 [Armatimonadota bacterium]|nr:hypothetical protein [Armatimonadota bacterium]MCX7777641.1 hypothetical protein [Armatimonadota bacterium]MDW8025887.1 hypothetical protein [Armatimonadota bacterium]
MNIGRLISFMFVIFARFQQVDRRIIYMLVWLLIGFPIIAPYIGINLPILPMYPTRAARSFFETVESVPNDKVVLVACDFDPGTLGENGPQCRAVIEHLMRCRKKFIIMGLDQVGPTIAQAYAEELGKKYGYRYGIDFCNFGWITGGQMFLERMCRDIHAAVRQDKMGTPINEIPMMRNVRSAKDIGLVAEFTGAGLLPLYIATFHAQFGVKLAQGCTGIIGPEQFPYLDTGQLSGLLVGLKGAAEYEEMLKIASGGKRAMLPQSAGHLLIIILVALGNLGMWAAKRVGREG